MTAEKGVVEAALYSAGRSLDLAEIAQATGLPPDAVKAHLDALASDYDARGSALEVARVGDRWTLQIRFEYAEGAQRFATPELSRDLLKTAALIAYHQPILQSNLGTMIGWRVYEHTQALERLGLIVRKPKGRSLELTTSRSFPEFFGLRATDREGIRKIMADKAGVPESGSPPEEPSEPPAPSGPERPREDAAISSG